MRTYISTTTGTTSDILGSRRIWSVVDGTRLVGRHLLDNARILFGWLADQAAGFAAVRMYQAKPVVTGAHSVPAWMGRTHLCSSWHSGEPRSEFPVSRF